MLPIAEKLQRLSRVASMYYEKDMTQSEIARELGISRPMISKLLKEAKELGIVTVTIKRQLDPTQMLADRLKERFSLNKVHIISTKPNSAHSAHTNREISRCALSVIRELRQSKKSIGLGWGSMVGEIISALEDSEEDFTLSGDVFPLVGGVKASYRSYHPNELVRAFADKTGMNATYLYMPAIFDSEEEKSVYEGTEAFKDIEKLWSGLDTAFINISNYPSSPDIATAIRFGDGLLRYKAVGNFLAHYYNQAGDIIEPYNNIVMQISLHQLRDANEIVALCNCHVKPESLAGALRTGIFSHLIVSDELAVQVLQL